MAYMTENLGLTIDSGASSGTTRTKTLSLENIEENGLIAVRITWVRSGESKSPSHNFVYGTAKEEQLQLSISGTVYNSNIWLAYDGDKTITLRVTGGSAQWQVTADFAAYLTRERITLDEINGFRDDKSKALTYEKGSIDNLVGRVLPEGRIVIFEGTDTLTKGSVKTVNIPMYRFMEMFDTSDTTKVHILESSLYRVSDSNGVKSWNTSLYYNSSNNCTYPIPYMQIYDEDDYPWFGDQVASYFLYNPNQISNTETVKYRFVALVEN